MMKSTRYAESIQGKHCTSQANCTYIKGTTCLRSFCLCGDNTHPSNGICSATHKRVGHICQKDDDCVEGAECQASDDKPKGNNGPAPTDKTCQCLDNLPPTTRGTCS
ncbi:hypothetical protein NQ315_014978, partial [Exocentrus adspersus]